MSVRELLCTKCGAPLPPGSVGTFACPYCGATMQIVAPAPKAGGDDTVARDKRFVDALDASLRSQHDAAEALTDALGVLVLPTEIGSVVRAVLAIVREFEQSTGASIQNEALPLSRVAQGYLRALADLPSGSATLNLPFLAATPNGPVHLEVNLTPDVVAGYAREPAPAPTPAPAPPPKKKGWFS